MLTMYNQIACREPLHTMDSMMKKTAPTGKLILQTLAMPADTNPYGDIFGGWIMSQMDISGGILAGEATGTRIVTVAAESIRFIKPVHVGDVVCFYGEVEKIGTTSVTIHLEVWVKSAVTNKTIKENTLLVTQAAFTYVSVDSSGKKRPIEKKFVK